MKNAKKIVMGGVAALALVTASVMGTMAYLQSTDEVNNTFTVGKVNITLDEAKTNENGDGTVVPDADRVKTNNYKLMPGHTYTKDPTVHVEANSEDCYLFVTVKDDLKAIEDETTVAAQIEENNWVVVSEDATNNTTVYVYSDNGTDPTIIPSANTQTDKTVFSNFKVKGDVVELHDNEEKEAGKLYLNDYAENKNITVNAYAIQADGFSGKTANEIWNAIQK